MRQEEVRYIVVHCSATRSSQSYSVAELERDHRARGYRSAGYHYYITRDGVVHPLRALGEVGAHARGYNRCSIGVCYEGGLDASGEASDTRTLEQRYSLQRLLDRLKGRYPKARVVGHRDLSPDRNGDGRITPEEWVKLCPCYDAGAEYMRVQRLGLEAERAGGL